MKKFLLFILTLVVLSLVIYYAFPGVLLQARNKIVTQSGHFRHTQLIMDGDTIHYYDNRREDKPIVIFLHGYSDRAVSWFPFVNSLSKDYHIIVPDLLGHGENRKDWTYTYSLENQADFIQKFKTELGIGEFHLVGISMGGGVAGKYAVKHSNELHSLSLISSAGINGNAQASAMDLYMDQFKTVEEKEANFPLLPFDTGKESARLFKQYIFVKDIFFPPRLYKYYLSYIIKSREFCIKILKDFVDIKTGKFSSPLDDDLQYITSPVLVIWGKQDPLLDVSCVPVFEKGLPSPPEVVIIDDCGHATIVEQPEQTLDALRGFLERH